MAETYGENFDGNALLTVIKRIESLDDERRSIASDIKEVKASAKSSGFDLGVINFLLRERRQDPDDVNEFHRELDRYKNALGSVLDL